MRYIKIYLTLVLLISIESIAISQIKNSNIDYFVPKNYVNDLAHYYSDNQLQELNNWISNYEKQTGIEISIVTILSLEKHEQFDYSYKTFNRLGVGKAGANNGVLFMFARKEGKISIRIGDGLSTIFTDLDAGRIRDQQLIPFFNKGLFYSGTMNGLMALKEKLGTKPIEEKKSWIVNEKRVRDKKNSETISNMTTYIIIIAIIILSYFLYNKTVNKKKIIRKDINDLLIKFKELVNKTPFFVNDKYSGSSELKKMFSKIKETAHTLPFVQNPNIIIEPTTTAYFDIKSKYDSFKKSIDDYNDYLLMLDDRLEQLSNAEKSKTEVYKKINEALSAIEKLNSQYGYSINVTLNKESIDELDNILLSAREAIKSDIPSGLKLFNQYNSKLTELKELCFVYVSKLKEEQK